MFCSTFRPAIAPLLLPPSQLSVREQVSHLTKTTCEQELVRTEKYCNYPPVISYFSIRFVRFCPRQFPGSFQVIILPNFWCTRGEAVSSGARIYILQGGSQNNFVLQIGNNKERFRDYICLSKTRTLEPSLAMRP